MSDGEKMVASSSKEQQIIREKRLKQGTTNTTNHEISESLKREGMQFSFIFFSGDGCSEAAVVDISGGKNQGFFFDIPGVGGGIKAPNLPLPVLDIRLESRCFEA